MQDRPDRNDADVAREGGPYADFIRRLVESGRYGSAAEVILDALALLQEREIARSAYDAHMRNARGLAAGRPGLDSVRR